MNIYESVLEALLSPEGGKTVFYVFEDRRKAVRLAWCVENRRLGEAQVGDFGRDYLVAVSSSGPKLPAVIKLKEAQDGQLYADLHQALQVDLAIGLLMAERADLTHTVPLRYKLKGNECRARAYVTPEMFEDSYNIDVFVDDAFVESGKSRLLRLEGIGTFRQDYRIGRVTERLRKAMAGEGIAAYKDKCGWTALKERLQQALYTTLEAMNIHTIDSETD